MKRVKLLVATASAVSLLLCSQITVMAEEGWTREDGDWRYVNEDSTAATECWKKGDQHWYYLNADGRMERDVFLSLDGAFYYLNGEGQMAVNTWMFTEEEKAGHPAGWYYFGDKGAALRRNSNQFKQTINGKTYVFAEDGHMLTGWLDENGDAIDEAGEWLERGVYYAGDDGALFTGQWLDYLRVHESREDYDTLSQATGRDYGEYDNMWMYFDQKSEKVKGKPEKIVQKDIDGSTYGFDENGVMNQWWEKVSPSADATESRPISETPAKYYSGYDGGRLLTNAWFWMYPSENLDPEEYEEQECSWWYTDASGKVYANKIKTINGKNYAFDGIGRMQTGFVFFDGKSEFVSQYDVDAWESGDFISGNIYGGEKADLYFFHTDELNDGSMQTGKDIQIQLGDGIYTFGFAENGKAYGSRNKLQKKFDSYYINGLRLEADDHLKYGVVMSEAGDQVRYQVVDTNGKIVTGKKKIVQDKDGGYLLIVNDRFVAYVTDEDKPKWRTGEEGTGYYHYDKGNKEDPYAGGLIASTSSEPSTDGLLPEHRLNFD